jgi:hypothetical protein
MRIYPVILCSLGLLPAACSPPQLVPGNKGGATGATGGGGAAGQPTTPDSGPGFTLPDIPDGGPPAGSPPSSQGMICGLQKYPLERLPPELMLVLDRSGSMLELADMSTNTRWVETSAALIDVLTQTQGTISWGVKSFPNPYACLVTPTVEVEIGASSAPAIDLIRNTLPSEKGSGTPTAEAVQGATRYLRSRATPNAKYMVLATDGVPACPVTEVELSSQKALAAINEAVAGGIQVFVIGIATADTDADRILVEFARAGGRPRPGPQPYYAVEDRRGLVGALGQISKVVASCSFTFEKEPPSPNDVAVDVEGMRIMRDPSQMNGWNYNPGSTRAITIYGPACDRLKSGQVKSVDIIFGCPHVPIP